MIALVDCNNFYASCERVFRPDLENKPVAVLSNNDGCIIARSQEVKALGVPMGAPMFKWKQTIEEQGIEVFSANFSLYGDLSERVMSILKDECPFVEVYSIDEAFLDLSQIPRGELGGYCRALREKVRRWTGITVSIGVAPTKTLAKVANHVAKKNPKSGGCWLLMGTEYQRLCRMDLCEIWGVGRRLQRRLNGFGIHSVWDLRSMDVALARKVGSVNMERTVRELRGELCIPLEQSESPRQRILVSRSFGHDVSSFESLEAAVVTYASRAGEKLRRQNSKTQSISVFIHTNPYKEGKPQYKGTVEIPLDLPTNNPVTLSKAAVIGLKQIYKAGYEYKRGGVLLDQVLPESVVQLSLLVDDVKESAVGSVVDQINRRMGSGKIGFAAGQVGLDWRMNQKRRSPRYTTRWSDLPVVA